MKTGLKKRVFHLVGKAIQDWKMILDGEKILVGISGGKDSQALLKILYDLKARAPVTFDLVPVHIDSGFKGSFSKELEKYIEKEYGPIRVEYKEYGPYAHSSENRENPCFLCSRLRRKRLFEIAKEEGCNKIALGHHKDDLIETLFINICYAGKIGTMKPRQSFFDGELEIIRPLAYVEKHEIILFNDKFALPEFVNNCPSANRTKRDEIRQMLDGLYKKNKHIKGNIFNAMGNVALDYLLDSKNDRHSKPT
ncbi:MAG: tRNA 2-thiocytidine(32) synthetase TtcA [Desulfobacteraceae bacterium]|nr:tRNA 2-thiocytidine(32) synthetase TtcA [Desulfobacteraceae bacterium]